MTPADYDARGEAKRLLRSVRSIALCTLTSEGGPFASLVVMATMPDGTPILLLSRLSAHTQNLARDPRCSLLLSEGGRGDPLAHPRLTLTGRAELADDAEDASRRFLARNPKSQLYAGFPDFAFWVVRPDGAHLNGGFARAAQFSWADIATSLAGCENLVAGEDSALEHMNADHVEAIEAYATKLAGLPPGPWRLTGLDPEGMDLVNGDRAGRLAFPERVNDTASLRRVLVELAMAARGKTS